MSAVDRPKRTVQRATGGMLSAAWFCCKPFADWSARSLIVVPPDGPRSTAANPEATLCDSAASARTHGPAAVKVIPSLDL